MTQPAASSWRGRGPVRLLRAAAIAVAVPWAAYLVGMNLFLGTRCFRDLVGADPGSLRIEYAAAHSYVPGHIHVDGLAIRGRDSNIEWTLDLDRCDFVVSFLDLARKRFHASGVHGDGLAFRVRLREPSFGAEEAAALPPVPGFSDPPYAGPEPPPTDPSTLWSVWLEDVFAQHVREIWVHTIRTTGDFDVHGRWYFEPMRWLDVGPATLDLRRVDVAFGHDETWVGDGHGALRVTVHPSDVRTYADGEVLRAVSVSGPFAGTAHVDAVLAHLPLAPVVDVGPTLAPFSLRAAIEHGVLRPGMQIEAGLAPRARTLGLAWSAAVQVQAAVGEDEVGRASVDGRAVEARQSTFLVGVIEHLRGDVATRELDLRHPFSDARYDVEVSGATAASLRPWLGLANLAASKRVSLDSGPARASLHAAGSVRERTIEGRATLSVARAAMLLGNVAAGGDLEVQVAGRGDGRSRHVRLSETRLQVSSARVALHDVVARVAYASVEASAPVSVGPSGTSGVLVVDLPDVELPPARALSSLVAMPTRVSLDGGRGRGGFRATVDLRDGAVQGDGHVVVRDLGVQVGDHALRGDATLSLHARARAHGVDLSGSNVHFVTAPREASEAWWASAELRDAALQWTGGPRLRARVLARAKDAEPVEALVASEVALPARVAMSLLSTRGLSGEGEVVLGPSLLEARSVAVGAEGFDLHLELRTAGEARDAAVLVAAGPFQVGFDVDRNATSVRLFGAQPWFAQRVAAIRATEGHAE